ncbi:hypothetical protein MMC18_005374, partial [Xylographa bjoerkii]|nr:hypothetical protein [Xylographa bjoerkii]
SVDDGWLPTEWPASRPWTTRGCTVAGLGTADIAVGNNGVAPRFPSPPVLAQPAASTSPVRRGGDHRRMRCGTMGGGVGEWVSG